MPLPLAPHRQEKKQFVTPLVADVLFYELRDCNRIDFPAYGTPHEDTKKWPDHKLSFIMEEPEGGREGVYRFYYVADRANQDLYNFEVAYVGIAGREFRAVTRTYVTLRTEYEPHLPEFQTDMANVPEQQFEGVTYQFFEKKQARIGQQELDALYVVERWIFVEDLLLTTLLACAKDTPNIIPEKFRALVPTVQQSQLEEGLVSEDPTFEADDLAVSEDQVNPDVKRVTRTKRPGLTPPLALPEGYLTDTWGINTTLDELRPDGDLCNYGFGVKQSVIESLGGGISYRKTEWYPDDPDGDGIIYTLRGREYDEFSQSVISYTKSLIDASRDNEIADAQQTGPDVLVELQPLDKWHTIMIVSSLRTLPVDQGWVEAGNIRLPDQLVEVGVIWDSDSKIGQDVGGVDNIDVILANDIEWTVTAAVNVSASIFASPYTKIKSGYSGLAPFRVVRTFFEGPPTDVVDVGSFHVFRPVSGTITIFGGQAGFTQRTYKRGIGRTDLESGGGSDSSLDKKMAVHTFGPIEHTGLTLTHLGDPAVIEAVAQATGGSTPSGGMYPAADASISLTGSATLQIPDSSVPLQSGDEYIVHVEVKPWRFNWWVREVYYATIP